MKKIFFSTVVFCIMIIASCDYVSNVVETTNNNTTGGTVDTKIYRKVLIEDYTGHQCINCPRAAKELRRIDSIYHGKIIALAIHAGTFANTNTSFPTNYKTPEGTTYNNIFGFNTAGYPNGLVNRKGSGTPTFILPDPSWETETVPFLTQEADFQIKIKNTFESTTSQLNSEITVKALKNISGKYNVSVILIEDSIIGPQKYPTYTEPNYVFNHVMRGTLNTVWGEEIWNGSIAANDSVVRTYPKTIPANFVAAKCHVIAFVYDNDSGSTTYYEIKQAEVAEMVE